jgi:hypothetical protein
MTGLRQCKPPGIILHRKDGHKIALNTYMMPSCFTNFTNTMHNLHLHHVAPILPDFSILDVFELKAGLT